MSELSLQEGRIRIECTDGLVKLALMEDASVDHIISDPPYSERTHAGARTASTKMSSQPAENVLVDFDHWEPETFVDFCHDAVRVARRWVIMTCDIFHLAHVLRDPDLPIIRVGAWVKPNGAPQFTGDRPGVGWEPVLIMHREGKKFWNGGGHHAVWTHNVVQGNHPTEKPLPLIQRWLMQFTEENDLVFDPLMGSGTVGVACIRCERRFIGAEVHPKTYLVAEKRIEAEASQLKLFT